MVGLGVRGRLVFMTTVSEITGAVQRLRKRALLSFATGSLNSTRRLGTASSRKTWRQAGWMLWPVRPCVMTVRGAPRNCEAPGQPAVSASIPRLATRRSADRRSQLPTSQSQPHASVAPFQERRLLLVGARRPSLSCACSRIGRGSSLVLDWIARRIRHAVGTEAGYVSRILRRELRA